MKSFLPTALFALITSISFQSDGIAKAPKPPTEETKENVANETSKKKRKSSKNRPRIVPVIYYSVIAKSSNNGIGISMGSKDSGAVAIEWTAQLANDQQWTLKSVEGGWFQLIARHSGKALAVRNTERDPIVQAEPGPDQKTHWKIVSDSDGFVRIVNRESNLHLGIVRNAGAHGDGLVHTEKEDTDRQKWKLEVAEILYEKELPFQKLALPASEIIDKKHPTTMEELREFLHKTTWSIRYGSTSGDEEYTMTFDKKGTLTLDHGRVSTLQILGPKTLKLWSYDYAALSDAFNYFQAVDANGKVYYGVLLPNSK